MKKKVNYLVLGCLLIQMLAPLNVINAMKTEQLPTFTINSNQDLLTVESLSKAYDIPETQILAELTKGYTLLEVHTALQQQDAGRSLGELLKQLNPKVEEKLEQMDYSAERFKEKEDDKTNQVPTVTSQTYGEFVEDSGKTTFVHPSLLNPPDVPTVIDSTYGLRSSRALSSDKFPQSYDELAVKRLNMNADRAPYAGSINDNVSTINGTLQLQSTDMSLPGRNGMSFALNRNYNSSDAIYYNKEVIHDKVFDVIYYPQLTAKLFYKYSGEPVDKYGSATDFYFQPHNSSWLYHSFVQYNGQYTHWEYPLNRTPIEDFNNEFREELERTYKFDPANPEASLFMIKEDLYLSGTPLMAKAYTTGKVEEYPNSRKPVCYYIDSYGNCADFKKAYGNQVSEMSQEKRFPIGKGWSWDIPYIETKSDRKKYITLFGGSTYELDGLQLKGYPWKDLKLTYDGTVTVNDTTSSYVLTNVNGQKQYFSSDGRLLQISDSYQNNIQFEYSYVSLYGTVLTKIKDALQNEITIQYTSSEVTLTQGERTVKYAKTKDPQGNKELLSQVTDPAGRKTQYVYEVASAPFDLVGHKKKDNYVALLKQVYHPTNARTDFSYDSYNRSLGTRATETVYRVKSREDVITYTDASVSKSNHIDYTYQGDGGSVQTANTTFATTINNGRTQTTYNYDKVYIDDNTPEVFYNTRIKQDDGVIQTTTEMEYNRTNRWPSPTKTTTKTVQGSASSTEQVSQRTYDEYGNVLTETDPANTVSTYQYDATTHLLSSVTAPATSGLNSYMELERYPGTNGIKEVRVKENNSAGALKAQSSYTYDAHGNPISITIKDDAQDIVVNNGYGTQYHSAFPTEQSVQVTDAAKQNMTVTQRFEYNPSTGAMTKFTDGKGLMTKYEYDLLGRATKVIQPDSSTYTYTYNDAANEVTTVDPTGVTQITKWNPLGWKIKSGISGKASQEFGYDVYGRQTWSQDGAGNRTSYEYDKWDRLIATTYPGAEQAKATVSYDDINRKVISKDGENNRTEENYDLLGRATQRDISSATGALIGSVKFTYDAAGKVLTKSDGAGSNSGDVQTTQYSYDAMGRLASVTDAEANTTRYTYSKASNLIQIEYPDHNKKLKSYDQMGRVIQETDPLGQIETYFYDTNSNLTKSIDRKGNIHTYTYNAVNLLTASETTDEKISFSYDAAGRRLSMQDGIGTTGYTYEPSTGWLTQVKYPDQQTLQYAYDQQGKRTKMTDPFGVVTNYEYDAQNRITAVGTEPAEWDVTYQYKKNGLLAATQAKNGVHAAFTYEGVNLTALTQAKSGAAVQSFSYGYDLHANQTSKVENGVTQSFSYDALNRIATSSDYNENYSYDSRGNRLTLQSDKPINPVDTSYTYDNRNRLNTVQLDESSHVNYKYNGDNLLTERTENGITTRYYYDGDQMIAEGTVTNGVAAHKASYLRGNQLVARVDANGSKAYYVHNGHGDVVELRDANGNVINQYAYDLWGNPTTILKGVDNPFLYSGEYWDESVELQYLRARWYDPSMGRFINEDTYEGQLDNPLSLNLYTYVMNNPLTHVDPSGHVLEGYLVGINIDNARKYGTGSDVYWQVRSKLGSQAKSFIPGARNNDNNDFKFWFGVATMTSEYSQLNNEKDAAWAKALLVSKFQAKFEEDQSFLDGMFNFVAGALPAPVKAGKATSISKAENTFLPDAAYNQQLPKFVSPGTKSLNKYDEAGELKQTKYYDDYGRHTGWVDWTDHGRPLDHSIPHYHSVEWNAHYPINGYKTDFRWIKDWGK
ncbi:RHS repeat domain-containing protein [Paenibacillus chitinolyticus]|uniref:RHS repeat domain-containing protein n=1 Tax=Paenibacillus chitinolyticus TaxID=79263 RepID=UPI003556CC10